MKSQTAAEQWIERVRTPLADAGARLQIEIPDRPPVVIGDPPRAVVRVRGGRALGALASGSHLGLAEAFLDGEIEVAGDLREVLRVSDHLDLAPARWHSPGFWLRVWIDRRRFHRDTVAFHYDRSPEFFTPWLGRHGCYTHGFYESDDDGLEAAHERKLAFVCDRLELGPDTRVLDVGCGWGAFLEVALRRGIPADGITLSDAQADYVEKRLAPLGGQSVVHRGDFADFRPSAPYDAVLFMGSLEHMPNYRHVARFLSRHLTPGGRVYADFVTSPEGRLAGAFLRRYVFPGASGYVHVPALERALARGGVRVEQRVDDSVSYARTVRDWALRLEASEEELSERFGARLVRAFRLYLWGSVHFLEQRRTTGWHLIGRREAD